MGAGMGGVSTTLWGKGGGADGRPALQDETDSSRGGAERLCAMSGGVPLWPRAARFPIGLPSGVGYGVRAARPALEGLPGRKSMG